MAFINVAFIIRVVSYARWFRDLFLIQFVRQIVFMYQ